ncbi:MAG: SPOR domain-containing protein, partial [Prevotella sp.]|nr:SPOR domain-containing protein [Prevotella sp.]
IAGSQIVFNPANNMYRVIATTFDNKADAVQSRNNLRTQYPDAWLLYSK